MRVEVDALAADRGGRRVLQDVSWTVPSGTVAGLVGPNGGGKSTLLRAIAGIDDASAGTVRLDGDPLDRLRRRDVARRVAVMTQDHSDEFDMEVLELVLLGRIPHGAGFGRDTDADVEAATSALERVGATHLMHRGCAELSGGERQRVLFARVLAQDTPILVLDEPTNHLDVAHQLELLDLVRASGRTVLVALHDLDLAARTCDAVAVLAGGRLVASGPPADVLEPTLVRSVFDVDCTVTTHPTTGARRLLLDARAAPTTSIAGTGDEPTPTEGTPTP